MQSCCDPTDERTIYFALPSGVPVAIMYVSLEECLITAQEEPDAIA